MRLLARWFIQRYQNHNGVHFYCDICGEEVKQHRYAGTVYDAEVYPYGATVTGHKKCVW
jgi:hypothetical protein